MRSLVDDLGITVFLVTHDLDTLLTVVDRIIVLARGHVLADGPVREILAVDDAVDPVLFFGARHGGVVSAAERSRLRREPVPGPLSAWLAQVRSKR